ALGDVVLAVAGRERAHALSLRSGAAGEAEVEIEFAPVRVVLAADEDEVVRREQVAEVAVGKRAVMRRIARSLEAVELEGCERVQRRDLVVDEDASPGPRDAHELRQSQLR